MFSYNIAIVWYWEFCTGCILIILVWKNAMKSLNVLIRTNHIKAQFVGLYTVIIRSNYSKTRIFWIPGDPGKYFDMHVVCNNLSYINNIYQIIFEMIVNNNNIPGLTNCAHRLQPDMGSIQFRKKGIGIKKFWIGIEKSWIGNFLQKLNTPFLQCQHLHVVLPIY